MKIAMTLLIGLALAAPATAQTTGNPQGRDATGAASDEEDDPTDRRVVKRLNTRVANRLETRIEGYSFIEAQPKHVTAPTPNPYAPQGPADSGNPYARATAGPRGK